MATFGRYCLNIKKVLESWNWRGHFPPSPPPPPKRRNRVKSQKVVIGPRLSWQRRDLECLSFRFFYRIVELWIRNNLPVNIRTLLVDSWALVSTAIWWKSPQLFDFLELKTHQKMCLPVNASPPAGTLIYWLYRYVLLGRVWFSSQLLWDRV